MATSKTTNDTPEVPAATTSEPKSNRDLKRHGTVSKVGNLVGNLDLRTAGIRQTLVANGRMAVETPKEPGNWAGERETEFYDVVLFGTLAENAAVSLAKGVRVIVVGEAETERWTGKDGETHLSKRIIAAAIGPDLRWATAQVTRDAKPVPPAGADGEDEPF